MIVKLKTRRWTLCCTTYIIFPIFVFFFSFYTAKEQDVKDLDLDARLTSNGEITGVSIKIWVGKDYVNFIHKDFVELDKPFSGMYHIVV